MRHEIPDVPEAEDPSGDEEALIELGMPLPVNTEPEVVRRRQELETFIISNMERVSSDSGVIHVTEAVRELVHLVWVVQDEQSSVRRLLARWFRQQRQMAGQTAENRQWQERFGSNASRLGWIVITALIGILVAQAYESFRERVPVQVVGPVQVQTTGSMPALSHTPPGSR